MLLNPAVQFGSHLGVLGITEHPLGCIYELARIDGIEQFLLHERNAYNIDGLEPVSYTHLDVYKRQVSAYSYMALVPVIQPPIMRLLTTKNERVIRMKPPRAVSHTEKV